MAIQRERERVLKGRNDMNTKTMRETKEFGKIAACPDVRTYTVTTDHALRAGMSPCFPEIISGCLTFISPTKGERLTDCSPLVWILLSIP